MGPCRDVFSPQCLTDAIETVSLAQNSINGNISHYKEDCLSMSIALTFPGQGSQFAGMGAELADRFPAARLVFQEVDDALGEKLSEVIWNGPIETLTLTENAQPALMAVSLAVIRVLTEEKGLDLAKTVKYVAGHSLGEYSALASANALSLADTARLLRIRGRAMQAAVPVGEGAMAALLGMDLAAAKEAAEEAAQGEICEAANDNAPGQVVLSGSKAAVERAIEVAQTKGARRAMLLPVSAPFHCALMKPAADAMEEALSEVEINVPTVPVVSNVLAKEVSSPDEIQKRLVEQVTGMVRWRESVEYMVSNGVSAAYEIGAGRVLTGLARRIDRNLDSHAIGLPDEIEPAAKELCAN